MRSQEDIVQKIETLDSDPLDFKKMLLISYLDYDHAAPYLKETTTREVWTSKSFTDPGGDMCEYMEFALEKAHEHRGISASRSIAKMEVWLWLIEDSLIAERFDAAGYENYGVPKLMTICKSYEIEIPKYMRKEIENMAQGLSCVPNCDMGCGQ